MAQVLQKYNVFELSSWRGFLNKECPLKHIIHKAFVVVMEVDVFEHLVVESAQLRQIRHHEDDIMKYQFAVILEFGLSGRLVSRLEEHDFEAFPHLTKTPHLGGSHHHELNQQRHTR